MFKLIVGLGNPGREYELNRHNIGWIVLDTQSELRSAMWKSKFKGEYADFRLGSDKVYALKPQTFMNLSGESVQPLMAFFKIQPSEILVLHDELDLPFGFIGLKKGGGLAGHNGLKSIAKCLGTQDFYRMRIGIGRPDRGSVSNWVLSNFPVEQTTELEIVTEQCQKALESIHKIGFAKTANQFNKKNFLEIK